MTRDIFNPAFGTADVIVAATLLRIGKPASLSIWSGPNAGDVAPDVLAERNARRFIEHFGDRKIAAIKAVRDATGLSLRDAKDAVSQVYETYGRLQRKFLLTVTLEDDGSAGGLRDAPVRDIERLVSDQLAGGLDPTTNLVCADVDVFYEQETP